MTTGWIDRPPARSRIRRRAIAQRREALSRPTAGTYLIVPAGQERVRANDTFFRFALRAILRT